MLTNDIKINADNIWRLLSQNGKQSIQEIEELTGYKATLILLSLGWLSNEGKVSFVELNNLIYVETKQHAHSEIYY